MNSILSMSSWGRFLGKKMMKGRKKFKAVQETNRWNIVTGDKVKVIQGLQSGQEGVVTAVLRKENRIIIEGVNMRKRIVKPTGDGTLGKMILKACSLHYSNVMLIDPTTGIATKISRRYLEDGQKVRISKRSGQIIPKPDPLQNRTPRSLVVGPKDTSQASVFEVTFDDYEKFLPYIYENEKHVDSEEQKIKEENA